MSQVPVWTLWLIPTGTLLSGALTAAAAYIGVRVNNGREDRRAEAERGSRQLDRLYADRLGTATQILSDCRDIHLFLNAHKHQLSLKEHSEKLAETTTAAIDGLVRFELLFPSAAMSELTRSFTQSIANLVTASYALTVEVESRPDKPRDLSKFLAGYREASETFFEKQTEFRKLVSEAIGARGDNL